MGCRTLIEMDPGYGVMAAPLSLKNGLKVNQAILVGKTVVKCRKEKKRLGGMTIRVEMKSAGSAAGKHVVSIH